MPLGSRIAARSRRQVRDGGSAQLVRCFLQDLCRLAARSLAVSAGTRHRAPAARRSCDCQRRADDAGPGDERCAGRTCAWRAGRDAAAGDRSWRAAGGGGDRRHRGSAARVAASGLARRVARTRCAGAARAAGGRRGARRAMRRAGPAGDCAASSLAGRGRTRRRRAALRGSRVVDFGGVGLSARPHAQLPAGRRLARRALPRRLRGCRARALSPGRASARGW